LLALRWTDLAIDRRKLRIERAREQTKKYRLRPKPPKTAGGLRTIDLDDDILAVLLSEKERHLRICSGHPVAEGRLNVPGGTGGRQRFRFHPAPLPA
jgi:hypothetical protein